MRKQWLKIEMLSELVLTRNAVTEGGHETLDYLPGSVLLGAVARHYAELGHEVFWSGKVRFGNGYLLPPGDQETQLLPVPLTYEKSKVGGDSLSSSLVPPVSAPSEIRKQIRQGYVPAHPDKDSSCPIWQPQTRFRMKTAIDRDRFGAAAESKLFGYQSLAAGQCFAVCIEADDEVPADTFERIQSILLSGIRLGRSRSAEYGLVSVSAMDEPQLAEVVPDGRRIVFYLASETAPVNPGSAGSLAEAFLVDLPALGLPPLAFDCHQSQVRTRSYWPWNRFYNSPDVERQVLCAGSVVVAELNAPIEVATLRQWQDCLRGAVGLWRQEGLGQVLINPSFVLNPPKTFKTMPEPASKSETPTTAESLPSSPLVQLVERRFQDANREEIALADGRQLAQQWMDYLNRLRALDEPYPDRSQWSAVRQMAVQCHFNPTALTDDKLNAFFDKSLRRGKWHQPDTDEDMAQRVISALVGKQGLEKVRLLYHAAHEMHRRLGHEEND